ncbi:hypothetical protein [Pedococcus bigeumensis]|uniref:hypothetical protein n=1 Tax=Pedococcus bigeumensis TaxID=433644 RepID=UPI0019D55496|nr:hypothetical protein [Pedococcus bigeumensis]
MRCVSEPAAAPTRSMAWSRDGMPPSALCTRHTFAVQHHPLRVAASGLADVAP